MMTVSAVMAAAKLLARREHTAAELQQKLSARGYSTEEIAAALERLQETDLQSDERFCSAYLREQQQRFGDFRLCGELMKRGIAKDDAVAALAAACLPPEGQRAAAVLQRKYPQGISAEHKEAASRFLYSRGFSGDSIRTAISGNLQCS